MRTGKHQLSNKYKLILAERLINGKISYADARRLLGAEFNKWHSEYVDKMKKSRTHTIQLMQMNDKQFLAKCKETLNGVQELVRIATEIETYTEAAKVVASATNTSIELRKSVFMQVKAKINSLEKLYTAKEAQLGVKVDDLTRLNKEYDKLQNQLKGMDEAILLSILNIL